MFLYAFIKFFLQHTPQNIIMELTIQINFAPPPTFSGPVVIPVAPIVSWLPRSVP